MSICSTMRLAALLSAGLLAGSLLLLPLAETTTPVLPTTLAALILALGAVAALGIALILALWPVNGRRSSDCLH